MNTHYIIRKSCSFLQKESPNNLHKFSLNFRKISSHINLFFTISFWFNFTQNCSGNKIGWMDSSFECITVRQNVSRKLLFRILNNLKKSILIVFDYVILNKVDNHHSHAKIIYIESVSKHNLRRKVYSNIYLIYKYSEMISA